MYVFVWLFVFVCIGVYGRSIERLRERVDGAEDSVDLFEEIVTEVREDLRLDAFPHFLESPWFGTYLRCKLVESSFLSNGRVTLPDFAMMRVLGRGAFGIVAACRKKDTGKLYAMKQIGKKRVQATDSAHAIMAERNFLAMMESKFVTCLRYAFMDRETLYLVYVYFWFFFVGFFLFLDCVHFYFGLNLNLG